MLSEMVKHAILQRQSCPLFGLFIGYWRHHQRRLAGANHWEMDLSGHFTLCPRLATNLEQLRLWRRVGYACSFDFGEFSELVGFDAAC